MYNHGLQTNYFNTRRLAPSKWLLLFCTASFFLIFAVQSSLAIGQFQMLTQLNEKPDQKKPVDDNDNPPSSEVEKSKEEMPAIDQPMAAIDEPEEAYPTIMRDLAKLPFPVRRMRELILEATQSGDIEKLRPLIGYGDDVTMLSLGGIEEDPLNFLKSLAGDAEGHEILAILSEVLESGYVRMDEGSENELYVWPYFFAWPLDKLTPTQRVELFRLVTYGDYEDMESFGAYIFYRLGITPRGRWRFFVAGD